MTVELELRGITKRFPGVVANDDIDLVVRAGEIHALVGENGAGKTTLMSILYGLFPPDEGEIRIRGEEVGFHSALDAIRAGLGMVHQSFKLFPSLTVAQNVVFRAEPSRVGFVDRDRSAAEVRELADRYGLSVDPRAKVEDLPVGVLQRVEILKALYREARVLILDEPTAVLTPQERDSLFQVMRRLKEAGRTILFVTHKLGEVMAVSDRLTVLRQGRVAADLVTAATDAAEISRHMTGRVVDIDARLGGPPPEEPVLEVDDLRVVGEHDLLAVDGVSFSVRRREVVAIAGVAGNGQHELVEALIGLRPADAGTVTVDGHDVSDATVSRRRRAGVAYVPEDRYRVGTAATASIWTNLLMGFQRRPAFRRGLWRRTDRVRRHARRLVEAFDIRSAPIDSPVASLSGGNLQKLVVAREMEQDGSLLIAEQPTRGVDIGSIDFIHHRLTEFRDAGGAVLLVSAELSEILRLATRILVMYEGRIVAELDPAATDESEIGLHMTGGTRATFSSECAVDSAHPGPQSTAHSQRGDGG
ncbi:MAG: ABC transporter ATP-binding protein [Acidimicrobiales bacterium]